MYCAGSWAWRARIPAKASGESRFSGFHPSGNLAFRAALSSCQCSRGGGIHSSFPFIGSGDLVFGFGEGEDSRAGKGAGGEL